MDDAFLVDNLYSVLLNLIILTLINGAYVQQMLSSTSTEYNHSISHSISGADVKIFVQVFANLVN